MKHSAFSNLGSFLLGGNQSVTSPASPQAHQINGIWWLMFWVCGAAFVLTMLSMAGAIWRRRKAIEVDHARDSRRAAFVALASGIVVVVLFVFLVASAVGMKKTEYIETRNALTIQIIGHQWWWEIIYNDPVPSQIVTTANEIHVPVGKPVLILTSSRDVIHSFWAPNLNGKRDLIPGYQTAFWIQADHPGVYRGQCAEFCGHQHAHMGFEVIADPAGKYEQWKAAQILPAKEPEDDVKRHGREVFLSHPCVMCHTIRGTDAGSRVGPDLTHLASRGTIAAGTLKNTTGNLAGWIMNSQSIKPGNHMPSMSLQPDDLQALLAYLGSLQ